jgi:hypothetical protein
MYNPFCHFHPCVILMMKNVEIFVDERFCMIFCMVKGCKCLFMSIVFILIQIKFDIHINNDELFKTIWKHKKKNKIDCH